MARHLISVLSILLLISCRQQKEEKGQQGTGKSAVIDSVAIVNDPKNSLYVQAEDFSQIDSSGILIFPLTLQGAARDAGSFSYSSMPAYFYWNIIFLNSRTNVYHLLSERKMIIRNYHLTYRTNDGETPPLDKYIFYSVIADDFNKDGKLTEEDPAYLFISDREGNDFRQISPGNYDLQNWEFIKPSNKVIFTAKKDSDGNKKYDNKDELFTFEVAIDKRTEPGEVFSADFKNKLKIMYHKDWKQVKE